MASETIMHQIVQSQSKPFLICHLLSPNGSMPSLKNLIENEYGAQSKLQGAAGHNYVNWAAKMAVEMGTGVSWVMCKEDDAPDLVVNFPKEKPGPEGVRGRKSDNTLIKEKLGWAPTMRLKDGLRITYFWIKEQIEKEKAQGIDIFVLLRWFFKALRGA
ncbi:hypothetical protein JHK87_024582 [Glycine soja]|nr:hypothetical protein JHK87_024582 [Glycine soja]